MNNPLPIDDLREFHRFLGEKVGCGGAPLSPEEAQDEWRAQHPVPGANAEELAAIQEAMDDMEKGDRGIPFTEFDHGFRRRHGLPPARSWRPLRARDLPE
jgi:hypothetical protein